VPNLLPREQFCPGWARQISLGLDLRGGSYLLLEVDTSAMVRERLEARGRRRPARHRRGQSAHPLHRPDRDPGASGG
jgi:preprotein translocase subunit SecD